MELREQNLRQQQKPGAGKELRDARWQRKFVRKSHGEGCRVRSLGNSRCSVGPWREASKVAPSPGEALLGLFPPGPVECISAQIFPGSEGSSAYSCL